MTPQCPKCNDKTITMTISRDIVYQIHSIGLEEYDGKEVLQPIDYDLIDTDETGETIYSCTKCNFESRDLKDFKPN